MYMSITVYGNTHFLFSQFGALFLYGVLCGDLYMSNVWYKLKNFRNLISLSSKYLILQ